MIWMKILHQTTNFLIGNRMSDQEGQVGLMLIMKFGGSAFVYHIIIS